MTKPLVPPKRLVGKMKVVALRLPGKSMGGIVKLHLRNVAKSIPEYHFPIETGISGRDRFGKEIPNNAVGRWLFGTPDCVGHIRVIHWKEDYKVEFLADSPEIVHRFVDKLKEQAEV